MRKKATLLALVLLFAGLTAVAGNPVAAQDERAQDDEHRQDDGNGQDDEHRPSSSSSSNCPDPADFEIAETHGSASSRILLGGLEEIGLADVEAGTPEDLMVHLETSDDQLDIEVFHIVDQECVEFDEANCDQSVTATTHQFICELDDPASGEKNYWVHFTNPETDELTYHTWTPDA